MTTPRDPDNLLTAYLADGIDVLPDRVVDAVLDEAHRTRQRTVLGPRRTPVMNSTFKVVLAAAAVVAVSVVGFALLPRSNPSIGSGPSTPPSASPASVPTASPSATLEPISLTGQIAFERRVDGNTDIYLMNLDRTGLVRVTTDPAPDTDPSWSSDGARIVFTRAGDIYAIDADGSDERRLADLPGDGRGPAYSPDGETIAYGRGRDGAGFALWLMDADGSNQREAYKDANVYVNNPEWMPDGRSLIFARDATGVLEIWQLDIATSSVTPLAQSGVDNSLFAVARDGSTVGFQSDRTPGGIFLMDADGSNVRHLTGNWTSAYPLSWSPDGQNLAYWQADGWLYLIPMTGGESVRWTEGTGGVAWRPAS